MSEQAGPLIGPASEFQEKYLNSDAQIMLVGGEICASIKLS